jgi:hypothetical protein
MTKRNYCADDIMGLVFAMLLLFLSCVLIYAIIQFQSPETQKTRQCQAIFDTQKNEINEMQQEYYNKNCK